MQLVDERGCFKDDAGELKGIFCKKADPVIIENLRQRGLLFKEQMYAHSYPFCWRCDTPLLYYARKSWFIRMSAMRERLLKSNSEINWMPESIGTGRMGNFLENVIDWGALLGDSAARMGLRRLRRNTRRRFETGAFRAVGLRRGHRAAPPLYRQGYV